MEFRKATAEDVEQLLQTRMEFLSESHRMTDGQKGELERQNRAYLRDSLADGTFVAWVAEEDGRFVATSGITFYRLPPNTTVLDGRVAYISNMYTAPDWRGRGLAPRLFAKIMEEARLRGHRKVLLNATDMGRPIYEKYGFADVDNEMVYHLQD